MATDPASAAHPHEEGEPEMIREPMPVSPEVEAAFPVPDWTPSAATPREPWEVEGSFVIERYEHTNPDGVQWLVYRVKDGFLGHVKTCKTRKEAALYVAGLSN